MSENDSFLKVDMGDLEDFARSVGAMLTPALRAKMNREIAFAMCEMTADHIAKASVSRHKTADRLGAQHTGFLEFAPGRVSSKSRGGGEIRTSSSDREAVVTIENTPGLSRAFHDLEIRPVKAKWLTIPINKVAYARRCRELEADGWSIFRPRKKGGGMMNVLFGSRGASEGRETIPLYALCSRVVVPQDRGLLPSEQDIEETARDTAEATIETEAL